MSRARLPSYRGAHRTPYPGITERCGPRPSQLREQLRLLRRELRVGDQPRLVQLTEMPDALGDVRRITTAGRRRLRTQLPAGGRSGRAHGRQHRCRETAGTRGPGRNRGRRPPPPDPGRPAPPAPWPRPGAAAAECPSNSSGERHSTPLRSPTGNVLSPAFHFADDAPVQNQRKDTDLPSKDALPSYALNWSGARAAPPDSRRTGCPRRRRASRAVRRRSTRRSVSRSAGSARRYGSQPS